ETFADQAVIAIENARLFEELEQRNRELTEAVDRQTATSEVLRVIASSPTELSRVLRAILDAASRLCDAPGASLQQLRDRDGMLVPRMISGASGEAIEYDPDAAFASFDDLPGVPATRGTVSGRAFLERRTIHVPDLPSVVETEYPDSRST